MFYLVLIVCLLVCHPTQEQNQKQNLTQEQKNSQKTKELIDQASKDPTIKPGTYRITEWVTTENEMKRDVKKDEYLFIVKQDGKFSLDLILKREDKGSTKSVTALVLWRGTMMCKNNEIDIKNTLESPNWTRKGLFQVKDNVITIALSGTGVEDDIPARPLSIEGTKKTTVIKMQPSK